MTTIAQAKQAFRDRLKTEVLTPQSVDIRLENSNRDNPTSFPWVELRFSGTEAQTLQVSVPVHRKTYLATITIHVKEGAGIKGMDDLAELIINAFEGQTAGGVTYVNPSQGSTRRGDEGATGLVFVPFYFD